MPFNIGDHPFVDHASNVEYGTATYALASRLNDKPSRHQATLDVGMTTSLLATVRAGLLTSSHTTNDIAAHCRLLFGE